MSSDPLSKRKHALWRRIWQVFWGLRFVYVVIAVLCGTAWLLVPLRVALELPAPPLPSFTPEPPDLQETLVLGPTAYVPGTQGAVRVLVRDPRSGEPVPDAELRVSLAPRTRPDDGEVLYTGESDARGTAEIRFTVPDVTGDEWALVIDASGRVGTQRVVRPVTLRRPVHLALGTVKRIYRPEETVRAWLSATGRVDRRPVSDAEVTLTVLDAHGNRLCTETTVTSAYGMAHSACDLADLIHEGAYRVVAQLGDASAELAFTVETGPPDALYVEVRPGQTYLLSGQPIKVSVVVRDVYGQPARGASIEVMGTLGEGKNAFYARGETGADGALLLTVPWDEALFRAAGDDPAQMRLTAAAVDPTGRTGKGEAVVPAASQALWISARPEGGTLKPGIENRVDVRVVTPDGRPAACNLTFAFPNRAQAVEAQTDAAGQAWFGFTPDGDAAELLVSAQDAQGHTALARFNLAVQDSGHPLLLRPDRATYASGQAMQVEVVTPDAEQAVYLDLRIEGQPVATYSAWPVEGRVVFDLAHPDGVSGVLELDAYALLADGTLVRDVRQVIVEPAQSLTVSIEPGEARYEAGGTAHVSLSVGDGGGHGVAGVLAVAAVSGHLAAPWAGAARAEDLQTMTAAVPAVDLSPQQAEVASQDRPVPATVQRQFDAYEAAWGERRQALTSGAGRVLWALWALPVLLWIAVLGGARRLFGAVLGSLPLLLLAIVAGALLAHLGQALLGTGAVIALGMGWFGALLALLVRAWTHRDGWALLISSLVGALLASLLAWQHAVVRGAAPALDQVIVVWAALGVGLLALASYGVWMARAREWSGALSVGAIVLLLTTTWTGSVLAGAGPDVPVQEALPQTTRPASRPAATRILPQDALLAPLPPVAAPLFPAMGSGHMVYWDPQAGTDARGNLTLAVPLAGLPGDVRLSVLALSAEGAWGTAEAELAVHAPLAIEPALPAELTVGDALDVPLVLVNGLPVAQTVQVTLTQASWFRSVRGTAAQEVVVPAAGVAELSLPIQVREWGAQTFTLTARAGAWSDVITRTVTVRPNAKWVARAYSWWVGDRVSYKFRIPWSAVPDTDRIAVKLTTGHHSVLSEALQRAAAQEGRSFDEVAGAVQARLLHAAYLRRTGQWAGERRAALERGLAADVQRLLAFESPDGGFSALGRAPADLYRTASALRCLSELAAFTPVDAGLLDQTAMWLVRQRTNEGTWQLADPPRSWSTVSRPDLPVTAYVIGSLVDAGYGSAASTGPAVEYLERHLDQSQDPYVLALVVNALVAVGEPTDALGAGLARLAEQAEVVEGLAWWPSKLQSLSGASGANINADGYRTPSVKVEAAALATYALSRAGVYPERVAQGLAMLVDSRDVYGTWNAPQATALALRAFLSALPEGDEPPTPDFSSTVRVTVDEVAADPAVLSGDMSRVLVFDRLAKGYNDVEIAVDGDEVAYQIVGSYYLPWSQVSSPSPEEEALSIEVSYDRTSVVVGETITATVGVMLNRPGVAPLVSLELGLPPGLVLEASDLDALVSGGTIARYERVGGRLQVYVRDLSSEQPIRLHYRLHARTPLSVWTQPTYGVDIANPQRPAVRAPVEIEVLRPGADADE